MSDAVGNNHIRLALVGVGRWGNHLLRNFLSLSEVTVAAVVDHNVTRLSHIQRDYQLPPETLVTQDVDAILAHPNIDAVAIATPAATHYPLIQTALKFGKHVLAEKPLTLNVAEADELHHLAESQQRHLVIDHTYLFHPAVAQGQRVLAQQRLGPLRYGYAARTNLGPVRTDVDALWDLSIHDITIFNHWLGEQPLSASARGQLWLDSKQESLTSGLSDVVWLHLAYPSGIQVTIHVSWSNPDKQRRLCITGDRGTLIFDELQPQHPLVIQHGYLTPTTNGLTPSERTQEVIPVPPAEPLQRVCQHFVQCIQENHPSNVSNGQIAIDVVRTLSALSQSLALGGQPVAIHR